VVAALCVPALVLVSTSAPADAADRREVSVRREARALRSRPVRRALVLAALVNGATFATFAYLAVIASDVARLPQGAVPVLLAAFGAGAFIGVTVAGRSGSGGLRRGVVLAMCALPVGWAALAVTGAHPVPLVALAVVQGGLSFGVGSTLAGHVMRAASDAPSLGGAFATVGLNVGAVLGPLPAGLATGTTGDYRAAPWVSAVLAAAALAVIGARRRGSSRSWRVPR
ncbi:Cmx/CmrA family chloramphenicol efflux MFS transporter, partial [Actinosynnema sp. NPDC023658]